MKSYPSITSIVRRFFCAICALALCSSKCASIVGKGDVHRHTYLTLEYTQVATVLCRSRHTHPCPSDPRSYLEKWRRENPTNKQRSWVRDEGGAARGWFVGSLAFCVPLFRAHPDHHGSMAVVWNLGTWELATAPVGSLANEGRELGTGCGGWLGTRCLDRVGGLYV